jgi:hypothetical protein
VRDPVVLAVDAEMCHSISRDLQNYNGSAEIHPGRHAVDCASAIEAFAMFSTSQPSINHKVLL